VGLACGGEIQIFVECLAQPNGRVQQAAAWLDPLRAECALQHPIVVALHLETGRRELLPVPASGPDRAAEPDRIETATRDSLQSDLPRLLETQDGRLFLQPFNPPLRLFLVGAVHIAQFLSRMASESGYAVTLIDPRVAFASDTRFPATRIERSWPDQALRTQGLDARTAIVTLTHDPKLDDAALQVALRSPAFYIGSLGSRKTHAQRLERLREAGFEASALARIHGPVGLDIGARSPAEIAISILAEITARLRGREL
jgi:xanthine dehydrogenase accessory factor